MTEPYVSTVVDSPVGVLTLIGNDDGLAAVLWPNDKPGRVRLAAERTDHRHPVLREAAKQLGEYFAGERRVFKLKLNMQGTAFQKKVWKALLAIPFGETRSYAEIARASAAPRRSAPSAPPMAAIRCRSSRRATESWALTAN